MDPTSYKSLLLQREGKVLTVTLNRPQTLNAIEREMEAELGRFFFEVATDDATDVVVITGAGRAFSAGGDFELMQQYVDHPNRFVGSIMPAKQLIFGMLDNPKPVIAKINGPALGLGATVALFSDIIFAAENAKIGDPHVKVGFSAGDGGAIIWPQLIGYARAKQYLLTGEPLTGTEAERIGLINFAVPAEQLDQRVDEFARRLASGASRAIQWSKATINIGLKQLAHSIMDASIGYEALSNYTRDHAIAVKAFREKEAPRFTGE